MGCSSVAFLPFLLVQEGRAVPRDLFPLPRCHVEPVSAGRRSRGVQQRCTRRHFRDLDFDRCVASLNLLATHQPVAPPGKGKGSRPISLAQSSALEHIKFCVDSLGRPPADLSHAEALRQLRIGPKYSGGAIGPGSYLSADVSLPAQGNIAVPLADLWGDGGDRVVDDFVKNQVHSHQDAMKGKAAIGLKSVYYDPELL